LPPIFTTRLDFSDRSFTNERDKLLAALSITNWNKSKAAKMLKWNRMKVYRALERYNIISTATGTASKVKTV
jgi:transcriptional regulator of acetoin/glycerol metabolism